MKREIIFRGRGIHTGDIHQGYLTINPGGSARIEAAFEFEWVDPSTVGQFTGLTDKNGTKIFEGDRVRYTKHPGYTLASFESIIIYDSNVAAFAIEGFPANIYFCDLHELQEDLLNYLEVIE